MSRIPFRRELVEVLGDPEARPQDQPEIREDAEPGFRLALVEPRRVERLLDDPESVPPAVDERMAGEVAELRLGRRIVGMRRRGKPPSGRGGAARGGGDGPPAGGRPEEGPPP